MSKQQDDKALVAGEEGGAGGGGVSLGKGAWDCDTNCEIPPEKEVGTSHVRCLRTGDHETCASSFPSRPMFLRRLRPWTSPLRASPLCRHARCRAQQRAHPSMLASCHMFCCLLLTLGGQGFGAAEPCGPMLAPQSSTITPGPHA